MAPEWGLFLDFSMDAIREVLIAMYLANAYANGPRWLSEANGLLKQIVADQETGPEAAEMITARRKRSFA